MSYNNIPPGRARGLYENTGLERLGFIAREILAGSHLAFGRIRMYSSR